MTYYQEGLKVIDTIRSEDLPEISNWLQRNDFLPEFEDKKGERCVLRDEKNGKPIAVISWYPAEVFEKIHDIKFGDVTSAVYIYEYGIKDENVSEQSLSSFLISILEELEKRNIVFIYFKENFELLKDILKVNRGAVWDEGKDKFMIGEVKYVLKSLYKNS